MKRHIAILSLLAFISFQLIGQPTIDSLRSLANTAETDSSRFNYYYELNGEYLKTNLDSALLYAEKTLEIAQQTESTENIVDANYCMCTTLIRLSKSKEGLPYCQKAKEHSLQSNDTFKILVATNAVGSVYNEIGLLPKAIEEYYLAKRLAEQLNRANAACIITNNLAIIEQKRGNFDQAFKLYESSMELAKKSDSPSAMMNTLFGLANCYVQDNRPDSALAVRLRLIQLAQKHGDRRMEAFATSTLTLDHIEMGNYEMAISTANNAEQIISEIGASGLMAPNYAYLGRATKELNDYPKAISIYQKALTLFTENSDLINVSDMHKELAELFEKAGNYDSAYIHLLSHQIIKDSLSTVEKEKAIQAVKSQYETEKKEEENKILELKNSELNKEKKTYFAIALAFLSLILILLFLFYKISKQKELIEKNNHLKDKLFAIVAHDLRSPLISLGGIAKKINFLIQRKRFDEIELIGNTVENAVSGVHKLLDNLLNWAMLQREQFPHHPESLNTGEIIKEVIEVYQNVAESKNIKLHFNLPENITVYSDRYALSTVVRNLVDNAIKFTPEGGTVFIELKKENNTTLIKIKDDGIGIAPEKLADLFELKTKKGDAGTAGEKGTGLGLVLCRELVEMNGGKISVDSQVGQGATFNVSLPHSN